MRGMLPVTLNALVIVSFQQEGGNKVNKNTTRMTLVAVHMARQVCSSITGTLHLHSFKVVTLRRLTRSQKFSVACHCHFKEQTQQFFCQLEQGLAFICCVVPAIGLFCL